MYFKIQGTYFKICALYFSPKITSDFQQLTNGCFYAPEFPLYAVIFTVKRPGMTHSAARFFCNNALHAAYMPFAAENIRSRRHNSANSNHRL